MIKLTLSVFFLLVISYAYALTTPPSITGDTEVCPNTEYVYTISVPKYHFNASRGNRKKTYQKSEKSLKNFYFLGKYTPKER